MAAFQSPTGLLEGVRRHDPAPQAFDTALQLIASGLLAPVGPLDHHQLGHVSTLTAWLQMTDACNLRCDYCYIPHQASCMPETIGRQAIEAVCQAASQHGFNSLKLKYGGGEPTLNFHLVLKLHDYARQITQAHALGLDGVVMTNGVSLTDAMIEALLVREMRIMVSLDGLGAEHDAQRHFPDGRPSSSSILASLERLAARGLQPTISVTISQRSLPGLVDLVTFLLDHDYRFNLNFYRHTPLAASQDLTLEADELIDTLRQVYQLLASRLPPYALLNGLLDRVRLDMPHNRPCGVSTSYIVIDTQGAAATCHMDLRTTFGQVGEAGLFANLLNPDHGVQNWPVEVKHGCQECFWRYVCAGGCPYLTFQHTGRYDVPSPNCRIYRELLPEVIRLEGLRLLRYTLPAS